MKHSESCSSSDSSTDVQYDKNELLAKLNQMKTAIDGYQKLKQKIPTV